MKNTTAITALGLVAMLAAAAPLQADPPAGEDPGMHERHHPPAPMLEEELELSDEQVVKLHHIRKSFLPKMRQVDEELHKLKHDLMELDPADPDYMDRVRKLAARESELVARLTVLRAQMRVETARVLTPEQRRKARALMQERIELRRSGHLHDKSGRFHRR